MKIVFGHKAQTMADSTFIPTQWAFDRANYQNGSPNSSKGSGGKSHMFKKNPNLLSSSTTNLTASKFSTAVSERSQFIYVGFGFYEKKRIQSINLINKAFRETNSRYQVIGFVYCVIEL